MFGNRPTAKPPSGRYHDRQWAGKMKDIGLQPGEPGGKETGQSVSHYIIAGGAYAKAFAKLAATGFQLHSESAPAGDQASAKRGPARPSSHARNAE